MLQGQYRHDDVAQEDTMTSSATAAPNRARNIALIIAGQAGAHAAPLAFPDRSLGWFKNSLAGLAGGGLGAVVLVATLGMGYDIGGLAQTIAGGGLGGALLVLLTGWISYRSGGN